MNKKRVFIIAEAGVNHNGCLDRAKKMVDVALDAKVDAIKFQTFKTELVVTRIAPKAKYQEINTGNADSQFEMIKRLELSYTEFLELNAYCQEKNILFLSTPFDFESLDFLINEVNIPILKIASGEITNGPFLLKSALSGKPIILSTGMSNLNEIEEALSILAFGYTDASSNATCENFQKSYQSEVGKIALNEKVSILHCTSEYPAACESINLRALNTIAERFGLVVGYSDHSLGIEVSIAAVALGAKIIEKHFTIDKNLSGPDHKASLDPDELKKMVESIRNIEAAMGNGVKIPVNSEYETLKVARRSLIASKGIKKGEAFTSENMVIKRPASGVSPMMYWDYLQKNATRDYAEDEVI